MAFPIIVNSCVLPRLVNPDSGQAFSAVFFWASEIINWSLSLSHPVSGIYVLVFILLVTNHTVTFLLLPSFDSVLSAPLRSFSEIREETMYVWSQPNSQSYSPAVLCLRRFQAFQKGLLRLQPVPDNILGPSAVATHHHLLPPLVKQQLSNHCFAPATTVATGDLFSFGFLNMHGAE